MKPSSLGSGETSGGMTWFGTSWGSPFNHIAPQIETPVGAMCVHCEEPVALGDRGITYANGPVAHVECHTRCITGSVAHIHHRCSCYVPGSMEDDPPGMTFREAARAAVIEAGMANILT
jgi:hypothetical protein